MKEQSCCFTGHRPEKLTVPVTEIKTALEWEIQTAISDGMTLFISRMARGVDLWAAQAVMALKREETGIKLFCAVPYSGFEDRWSLEWRQLYRDILAKADYTKVFFPSFTYKAFQVRNRWMVDHSARVIAVYNGTNGGTRHTIAYAEKQHVRGCVTAG